MDDLDRLIELARQSGAGDVTPTGLADLESRVARRRARRRRVEVGALSIAAVVTAVGVNKVAGHTSRPTAAPSSVPSSAAPNALPLSCAEARPGTIGGTPEADVVTATSGKPLIVGVRLYRRMGMYLIRELRLEVVPAQPGGPAAAMTGGVAVRTVVLTDVPAADRDVTLTFDGHDDNGATLPAGRYVARVAVSSVPAPGSLCAANGGTPAGSQGIITTIDWRG